MKLATLINKAVLVPCLWMQQMVGAQQWYAFTSGTPVRPSQSGNPPTRRAAVFHAIENCYISELISVGVARRLRSVSLA